MIIVGVVCIWRIFWTQLIESSVQDNYEKKLMTNSALPLFLDFLSKNSQFYSSPKILELGASIFEHQWISQVENMGFWRHGEENQFSIFIK